MENTAHRTSKRKYHIGCAEQRTTIAETLAALSYLMSNGENMVVVAVLSSNFRPFYAIILNLVDVVSVATIRLNEWAHFAEFTDVE